VCYNNTGCKANRRIFRKKERGNRSFGVYGACHRAPRITLGPNPTANSVGVARVVLVKVDTCRAMVLQRAVAGRCQAERGRLVFTFDSLVLRPPLVREHWRSVSAMEQYTALRISGKHRRSMHLLLSQGLPNGRPFFFMSY
jgi:hypothetical protein